MRAKGRDGGISHGFVDLLEGGGEKVCPPPAQKDVFSNGERLLGGCVSWARGGGQPVKAARFKQEDVGAVPDILSGHDRGSCWV